MVTIERYEQAIAAAEADGNTEAAEELRRRMQNDHPPKQANAGMNRRKQREAQREERKEEPAGFDMSKYEDVSVDRLTTAMEKAKADDNNTAYEELRLIRGVKRAEADGNTDAASELKARLGGTPAPAQTQTANTRGRQAQRQQRRLTIDELQAIPPQDLTPQQRTTLRAALQMEQLEAEAKREEAGRAIISDSDVAAGGFINWAENFTGTGDELYSGYKSAAQTIGDIWEGERDFSDIMADVPSRLSDNAAEGRELKRRFEEAKPGWNVASDALGFAGQLAGSAAAFGALPLAGTLGARVMQGGAIAGAEGAALGFLEGDTLENRAKGAVIGGVMGGGLGLGVGGAVEGVAKWRSRNDMDGTPIDDYVAGREADAQQRVDNKADETVVDSEQTFAERGVETAKRRDELANENPEAVEWAESKYGKAEESGGADAVLNAEKSPRFVEVDVPVARRWNDQALRAAEDYNYLSQLDDEALEEIVEAEVASAMRMQGGKVDLSMVDLPDAPFVREVFERVQPRLANKNTDELALISGDPTMAPLADNMLDDAAAKRGKGWSVSAVVKPITAQWKKEVGEGFAGGVERALLRALPKKHKLDEIVRTNADPLIKAVENDRQAKAYLLNMSNTQLPLAARKAFRSKFIQQVADITGEDLGKIDSAFSNYEKARGDIVQGYNRLMGDDVLRADLSLHSQRKPKTERTAGFLSKKREARGSIGKDEALKAQERPTFTAKNLDEVDEYANPFLTDNRWLKERLQDSELAAVFHMRKASADELVEATEGALIPKRIKEMAAAKGGKSWEGQANLDDLIQTTLYDSLEGVGPLLGILRSTNIAMGLANPKSAVLNLSEPMIMAMENDMTSIMRAYASRDGMPFTADELGLASVMAGDELKRIAAKTSGKDKLVKAADVMDEFASWSMKRSGFEVAALGAQNVQMKAAMNEATSIARTGVKGGKITKEALEKFNDRYGQWFSKAEQARLMRILNRLDNSGGKKGAKYGLTQAEQGLMRDFQLATLNDWQPLTAMGRSYVNNAYPMVRPFLLFTTYTTRMHEAISRQAVKHLGESRKLRGAGKTGAANKELAKAVASYTGRLMYSQLLWAVTNQSRQLLTGKALKELMQIAGMNDNGKEADEWDDFDAEGLMEDFMYGLASQATGGILPANKMGYKKGTSAMKKADSPLDLAKAMGWYGYDAVAETMVPTFILGEAIEKSQQRDSYQPLVERTPIVGPIFFKTYRKYGKE